MSNTFDNKPDHAFQKTQILFTVCTKYGMGHSGTQGLLVFTSNLNSNLTKHNILFAKTDTVPLNHRKGTL